MADAPAVFADPQAPATPLPKEGPTPVPPKTSVGNLYQDYNPVGALGNLFAPAYLQGFKPSEDAIAARYNAQNHLTDAQLESTKMPWEWMAPRAVNPLTYGVASSGAGIPSYLAYGDKSGLMDRNALMAAAQSLPYDMGARQAQIAQRVSDNQAASDAYRQQHFQRYGYFPEQEARGPYAGYGGGDPRFGGQGAAGWQQQQLADKGQQLFPGHAINPPDPNSTGMNFMGFMSPGGGSITGSGGLF